MNYNKKILKVSAILILLTFFISCSSDDDNNINQELLLGQWFQIGRCQEQNYLVLNQDDSYIWRQSNNISCEVNEEYTLEFTGNYSISGDNISFNEESSEVIENPSGNPIQTFTQAPLSSKIKNLTQNNLVIEMSYSNSGQGSPIIIQYQFEN